MVEPVGAFIALQSPISFVLLSVAATICLLAVVSAVIFFARKRERILLNIAYFLAIAFVTRVPVFKAVVVEACGFLSTCLTYFTFNAVNRILLVFINGWVLWCVYYLEFKNEEEVRRSIEATTHGGVPFRDSFCKEERAKVAPLWIPAPQFNLIQ